MRPESGRNPPHLRLARGVLSIHSMRAFTLGCCLAVAVTVAVSANQLIDGALRDPPPAAEHRGHRADESLPTLDGARLARLLGTPLRPRTSSAPRRPLPFKLLGTLDDHAAALADSASGQCRTLRIGESWNGVELVEVGHGRIAVEQEGVLVGLGIGAPAPTVGAPLSIGLTPRGANVAVSRAELERQLPALAQRALEGAHLVPSFSGSTMIGFKLFAVRPGSLYEELGLKNGDVFESVNGLSVANPAALGMLSRLKDERRVSLVVSRGGERLTWELNVE